jgi:peptide/nickel transport system permease protein/peptide/nickel transport system substrate-binding protein
MTDRTQAQTPTDAPLTDPSVDGAPLGRRTITRREVLTMLGAGAAVAGLGVPAFAQDAPKRGGVLRISGSANPSSLDPATGGAGSDHTYLWTMYDTLVEWDYDTLKPKPGMAEWAYPDPKTMVLTVKPGIVFHDGTPLDAQAVKFNIDRGRSDARSNIKADLSSVASVEIMGPMQVALKLARPDTALPAILSDRAGMMVSPKAAQELGADHDRRPVGAGPWKFVSWADNQKIVVTRHDKYWRTDRGFLDGIEFSIIPELATGLRSVVAGQNDMAYQLPPRLKPIIEKGKGLSLVTGPTLYCLQIYFNLAKKHLDTLKVRQAINYALDREAFVKAALSGIGEPATMNMPSTHWAYDKSVSTLYPHDLAKARALMKEAGLESGIDLTIGGYTDQDSVRRGEIVMEQLSKVGIRLKFINGTIPEISGQFFGNEKKFDLLMSAWTGRPDPAMTYGLMYAKDAYFNAGRVEVSPELSALLGESRASESIETRKQVFAKIQRIVMEQALVAPIAFQFEMDALGARVKGYKPNLLGKPKYEFISLAG